MVAERDRDPSEVFVGGRTRQDYIDEVASDHWSTEELAELLIEFDRRRERIRKLEMTVQYAVDNFGDHLVDYKHLCKLVQELGLKVPD